MALIGIDLHTDSFYVVRTRVTAKGEIRTEKKYELHGESWEGFAKSLSLDDYVLIEATTNSFWFYDRVRPLVKECFVLNMNKVEFSGNKTDKIDARRLLDLLSYYVHVKGIGELPSVYVPRQEVRQLRSLLSTYRLNKRIVTQLKNRIHGLLKQSGIVTTRNKLFTKRGWKTAMEETPKHLHIHLGVLWRQLTAAKAAAEDVATVVTDLGLRVFPKEIELLVSIPGFSVFTATVLLADIETVDRFQSAKKFCRYLRAVPRVKGSNNSTHAGPTDRQSRSMTCTVLTQSLIHLKHAGPHFTTFYERVRVGKSPGKSRIALVRKTLVSAYYMLKRGKQFLWTNENLYERKRTQLRRRIAVLNERSLTCSPIRDFSGEESA
jgi:transposase